jgi:hypothetical protein
MHARSLFQTPKHDSGSTAGVLQSISSIMCDARELFVVGPTSATPATPSNVQVHRNHPLSIESTSPPHPSPSKLPTFLKYAEEHLGVKNAPIYKYALEKNGYGPDILGFVKDVEIVACGISAGDAIRLKRGADKWWNSPEAKRVRTADAVMPRTLNQLKYLRLRASDLL